MTEFARTSFVTTDGLQLAADIGGPEDAPLVILMHGGGQTRHSWAGAGKALVEAGYRVVNLDSRGHGESDWSAERAYGLDARIADIDAVIVGRERPFALVGASMGGLTSIHAVGHGGMRPSAMVLVDIVPEMEPAGVQKIHDFMTANKHGFASVEEAADAVSAYYPERPRPKDPSGLMKNLRLKEDGRLYWHWDPMAFSQDGPKKFAEPLARSTRQLGDLPSIPVLVVRGMLSDLVSERGVAAFLGDVPHAETTDIAQAGHMVAGDKNDMFNAAVHEFLARHMPA